MASEHLVTLSSRAWKGLQNFVSISQLEKFCMRGKSIKFDFKTEEYD